MTDGAFQDIGACVFDAYGTLFDVHSAAHRAAEDLGEDMGPVSNLWRDKQLQYTWLRSLMGAHADFWQVTGEALDFALAAHGIHDPALRERLMELYLTLEAYPDVVPTLEKLRTTGKTTAILSNGAPGMLQAAVETAGLGSHLDAVLTVEDVGIYKPDPRVYQLAVDRLETPAGRICFVSTNGWDACGAAHFGFRVAWMNRFNQQPERLPVVPAAVIESLDALPGLLGLA